MEMYGSEQYKQNQGVMAELKASTSTRRSPIEQCGEELEKELRLLIEAVDNLSTRINKVLTPEVECNVNECIGTPQPQMSPIATAFDYATNSVRIQRMALSRLAERVEL